MRYVTRDMASDAGDPSLEGQPIPERELEIYQCQRCGEAVYEGDFCKCSDPSDNNDSGIPKPGM